MICPQSAAAAAMNEADITFPSDWPQRFRQFQEIDQLLRCGICSEFFDTPMMLLGCSHNHCSRCIRSHLQETQSCPSCRVPSDSQQLKPNRLIEDLILAWKSCRTYIPALEQTQKQSPTTAHAQVQTIHVPLPESESEPQFLHRTDPSSAPSANTRNKRKLEQLSLSTPPSRASQPPLSDPSASIQPAAGQVVECPLCACRVKMAKLNSHMDHNCQLHVEKEPSPIVLDDDDDGQDSEFMPNVRDRRSVISTTSTSSPRGASRATPQKYKKSVVYSGLGEAKLRQLLKSEGISSHGDRQGMIRRHKQYLVLYNANQDASKKKSTAQLLRDLDHWEASEAKKTKLTASSTALTMTADHATNTEIENEKQQHLLRYHSEFDQLLAHARSNKRPKTTAPSELCNNDSVGDDPAPSDLRPLESITTAGAGIGIGSGNAADDQDGSTALDSFLDRLDNLPDEVPESPPRLTANPTDAR
ncbi:uncharacterized protein BJ171DRAFT_499513 [Polychytrium aggregatum]|uniref:uncharacterized protein n=1 Tax=Polychytrium aggregatum TaxID=110093 RepID=UPI0022FF0F8E|nr:uncharacterized protein BJ171DRAFT_499513 [Polychytrium aggregatum]KAI9205739.1 hypothetical protein BJ171DRAFT_499513 [Polychytrium aggregatum]